MADKMEATIGEVAQKGPVDIFLDGIVDDTTTKKAIPESREERFRNNLFKIDLTAYKWKKQNLYRDETDKNIGEMTKKGINKVLSLYPEMKDKAKELVQGSKSIPESTYKEIFENDNENT